MEHNMQDLPRKTLVTFTQVKKGATFFRLAVVNSRELSSAGKPGTNRVSYKLHPANLRDGKAETYNNASRLVTKKATALAPVTLEEVAHLRIAGVLLDWR